MRLERRIAGESATIHSDTGDIHSGGSGTRLARDSGTRLARDSGTRLARDSGTRLARGDSGTRLAGGGTGTKLVRGAETGAAVLDDMHTQPLTLSDRLDHTFERMVHRTGLGVSPAQALAYICLGGAVLMTAAYLWREELWISFLGLLVGVTVPVVILLFLQSRWQRQIQEQLPDFFYLLARSLRAGMSLEQAIALAGAQGTPPLSDEMKRCSDQIRLGLSVPMAIQNSANRLHSTDFNVFVSVVGLHQTTGGNLALQLDRLAQSTRDRNQYRGFFRSATIMGRMSAIFIGAAVPLIFLGYALFEPTYAARFFESTTGMMMLATAFGLELIGVIWLYFLLRTDY